MKKKVVRKPRPIRLKTRSEGKAVAPHEDAFDEIVELIRAARRQAVRAVNSELIELYWRIGDYLHRKIESDGWAKGTVVELAAHVAQREPGLRGFSPQNLWRMRQFFLAYRDDPKLSPLVRELPWTHNLIIIGQSKRPAEREFYLTLSPALIAEYQTQLPDKKLLAAKLHEFYVLNAPEQGRAKPAQKGLKKKGSTRGSKQ